MTANPNSMLSMALLGTGGHCPGLAGYDVFSDRTQQLLALQGAQSVYALARSSDNHRIAFGTKTGDIYVSGQLGHGGENLDHQGLLPVHNLSTPILSMTFLDQATLAVSDTAGRCGICCLNGHDSVQWLPTNQGIICALFRLDNEHLAGLSCSGGLVLWDWPNSDIIDTLPIPALPALAALVQPVYWPAKDCWVWPGQNGVLVFYDCQQQKISSVNAHRGDVYAVAVHQEELLSIGRTEACLKRWHVKTNKPVDCLEVPPGIVAATCWTRQGEVVLLVVHDTGKADIFSLSKDRLEFRKKLPGEAYRGVLGPDLLTYEVRLRQQRDQHAQELACQIQELITQGNTSQVEHLYRQLIETGYEHIACALQAEAARRNQDLLGELRAYVKLNQIIPLNQPESESTLKRFAHLLDMIWQIQRACTVYESLLQIRPQDCEYVKTSQRLKERANILKSGPSVIEAHIPLTTLVEAATILGEQLQGRYLYQVIGGSISCGVFVSVEELTARYNHIVESKPQIPLPVAEQAEIHWFSTDKQYSVALVIIRSEHPALCINIELGVKIHDVHLQTILEPVILFNASAPIDNAPGIHHNDVLLEKLHRLEQDTRTRGWLETVYGHVRQAARQVITRAMAESIA